MAVKICRICLALGVKVFKIGNSDAKSFIENIFKQSGYMQDLDRNHYICFECKALLDKSYNFIRRVLKAQEILFHVVKDNQIITPLSIKQIDRQVIGFNLVKDFKYIDVFITEDNDIKREDKAILMQEFECKTEKDDFDMPDPLENSVDYSIDKKEVDIDFGVHFKDFTDTESKIDIKIPINENSESDHLFDNFDTVIQYEFNDSVLEQVKKEIIDDTDCIHKMKNKKIKSISSGQTKKKSKKTSSKVHPCSNVTAKGCVINTDDKKNKKKNKPKKKEKGDKLNYGPEPYDGCVDSGQQIQQPDIPKYPVKCDHCNYEVPNRTAHFHHYLLEHKNKKYPYARQTGKQFVCQFCGLVNSKKSRHIDHELTHGTVSNFVCTQCPKRFVNKHRLQKHTYRTHPLQLLECDYCGKKVKSRESLMIHLRAHTGERPFKCPFCGAGFAHRGNIRPHIRANHKKCLEQSDTVIKRNKGKSFYEAADTKILTPENTRLCASEMFMHLSTVMNNLQ